MSEAITISEEQALQIMKALADPHRYEILKRLGECSKAMPCSEVRTYVSISPATLSHHMKELETAGLVDAMREGKFVNYRLRRDVLNAFFMRLKGDLA